MSCYVLGCREVANIRITHSRFGLVDSCADHDPNRDIHPLLKQPSITRTDLVPTAASDRGLYVYCVTNAREPLKLSSPGIGDNGSEVYTIHHLNLAAVVSEVPLGILDSTRENVLAHERTIEIVMRDHTVIPMSFGTIFKTQDDIIQLLSAAYDAFGEVLTKMRDKLEFGLKVLWDREAVIKQIEQRDDIRRLKNELSGIRMLSMRRSSSGRSATER